MAKVWFGGILYCLSLTERSFLLASCFGILESCPFFCLFLSTNQFASIFCLPLNIDWISAAVNVADEEDVHDEEGVLPTCANISTNSCLEHDTCAKIPLFSFEPNLL